MPIRFGSDPRPSTFQVIRPELNNPLWVIAGGDRSLWLEHLLHWLPALGRSVPCTHEDCPWCPTPAALYFYLPCLSYSHADRCWRQKVLTLPEKQRDFQTVQVDGKVFHFERIGRKNGPIRWKEMERLSRPQPFAGFPVQPSLIRMWGMYSRAVKSTPRPDVGEILPFEQKEGA